MSRRRSSSRGCRRYSCQAASAAPSAPPASPGGRLDPDVVEDALAQQLAVGHAVERDAAGQAEVLRPVSRRSVRASRSTTSSVTAWIEAARSISRWVSGVPACAAGRRRAVERVVGHGQAGAVVEVVHVEPERAVVLEVDQVLADQRRRNRLAVGRQAHQLVLAGVDLEPGVVGEGRIEQPQRMREVDLPQRRQRGCPRPARPRWWPTRPPRRGTAPPRARTG